MFFVIQSNIAKKEAEEDLFLHDKNATFHSASFHENFILFSMIIQQNQSNNQSNQTANQADLELCMVANKQKKIWLATRLEATSK